MTMKYFTDGISGFMLLLFIVITFCQASNSDGMIVTWVPINEYGYITVDQMIIGAPFNISSNRPFEVLINPNSLISTGGKYWEDALIAATSTLGARYDKRNTGRYVLPCANVAKLPALVYNIGGKDFVLPPSQYMAKDEDADEDPDSCISIFGNVKTKHPEEQHVVTVWGLPYVEYFQITFDKENNRVGLVQPSE